MSVAPGADFSPDLLAACVAPVADMAFALVDPDGVVQSWNQGAITLLGVPADAALGRPLASACGSEAPALRDVARLVAAGAPGLPVQVRRAGGADQSLHATATPFGGLVLVRLAPVSLPTPLTESGVGALALSLTRDAIMLTDAAGIVTYWSEGATRLFGWTADEIVGRPAVSRFPAEHRAYIEQRIRQLLTGTRDLDGEFEDWHKDGHRVWVDFRVRVVRQPDGSFTGLLGICHDITARKQAEAALEERDALYRAAIETTHDGFWILSGDGRLLDVNDAYVRKSGYSRDELLGMRIAELEASESPAQVAAHVAAIKAVGHARFETSHRAKDGTTWPMEITTSYSAAQDRFFVFVRDITERREAEQALREAEMRLRFALSAAKAGVWDWDVEADHLTWSPENYVLHDVPVDTPCTYAMWERAVHPDDLARSAGQLRQAMAGHGSEFGTEYRTRHRDGTCRWVLGRGHVQRDADGRAIRVFGINLDITENRETLEALRQSEARLAVAQSAARLGSWSWDPSTDDVWWSAAIYDLFGLPRDATPSFAGFLAVLHPDDRQTAVARVERVRAGADGFADDLRLVLPDGQIRWIDSRARVVRDEHGGVLRVEGTDQDITERKRAEEALRESQARLLAAQRAARLGSWTWDLRTNELWWSDTIYELFGIAPGTRPTLDLYLSLLHPEDRARFQAGMTAETPADFETFSLDVRVIRPDGQTIWVDTRVRLVREHGVVVRAEGTDQDVTARRRTEEALRASEQRLSLAQSAARMGSWSWDPREDAAWWSDATYDLYGVDRSFSRTFEAYLGLLHPDDRQSVLARMDDQHAAGEYTTDLRIMRPDGRMVWVANRVLVVRDETGAPVRFEGVDVDITARKRAEDALTRQNRLLEMIAEGAPLTATLTEVAHMVEGQLDGSLCSILLVDRSRRLRVGAAPSLPASFRANCEGVPVGPLSDRAAPPHSSARRSSPKTSRRTRPGRTSGTRRSSTDCGRACRCPFWRVATCRASSVDACSGRSRSTAASRGRPSRWHARSSAWPPGATNEVAVAGAAHVARVAIERHLAEEALRASEARFRDVLDASPALISLKDLDGRYLFVNRRVAEYTSRAASEWVGRTMHDLVPSGIADLMVQQERQVVASMQPVQVELTMPNPQGGMTTFLSLFFPLFGPSGEPYATCSVSTDITDQKKAQTQLDLLWNLSPDPLVILNLQGIVLQANPATGERFGWAVGEYLGRSMFDFAHPDDMPRLLDAQARLQRGEAVRGLTVRLRGREDVYRWVSWNVVPQLEDGIVHAFGRDVTEERRLAEQLQQAQKIEAVGQLAGGIAHDFNNLLTVINGFAALLLGSPALQEVQREPLKAIHDAGDRAAGLTAQLLAFSRKAMVEPKVLDLSAVTDTAARMLRRLIGEDIRVETRLGAGLPRVRIDPNQFEQVLMNLVLNARDAMPTGGLLRIETSLVHLTAPAQSADDVPAGPYVQVTVSDTGEGMSPEVRARIFEPFFTTKGVGKGTGLGLATVYGIVRQAGGTIVVESEEGRGATFSVRLPALDEPGVPDPAHRPGTSPNGHECVLLVEDEDGVRRLTRVALEMQGYTVLEASSAGEAFRVAGAHAGTIHLLVTDVVMPGAGGRQLADELRRHRPDLRVLYMSGYTNDAVVRHGVEANIDAFLQKPFTPLSLARKVREVLDASR